MPFCQTMWSPLSNILINYQWTIANGIVCMLFWYLLSVTKIASTGTVSGKEMRINKQFFPRILTLTCSLLEATAATKAFGGKNYNTCTLGLTTN